MEPERLELDALLAEYNTLRCESLQAIRNRVMVLTFTFAGLAVLINAVTSSTIDRRAACILNIVVIPILSGAALLIWLGEYRRMMRAGRGAADAEGKINRLLNKVVLDWEANLSKGGQHMTYPYVAVFILFTLASLCSTLIGLSQLASSGILDILNLGETVTFSIRILVISNIIFILNAIFIFYAYRCWRRASAMRQPRQTADATPEERQGQDEHPPTALTRPGTTMAE